MIKNWVSNDHFQKLFVDGKINQPFRPVRAKSGTFLFFFVFLEFSYEKLTILLNRYRNHITVAHFTLH